MPDMNASHFPARLRELRERAGLTQKQLADRAGLSVRAVAQWEQGARDPGWSNVVALCKALDVSCDDFLEEPTATAPAKPGRPPKAMPATPPAADLEKTAKRPRRKRERGGPERRTLPAHSKGVIGDRRSD